jgi:hypothetical protein
MSIRTRRAAYPEITFRSKLEARWSVIFDGLCLPWEFEPVTFDLPSGVYVPDFRIFPDDDRAFWIEVKGQWPNAREFEVASEINLYDDLPLLIVTGDVPRQANGGTAWWFDQATGRWSMLRPEEALIRVIYRHTERKPDDLGELWEMALSAARHEDLMEVISS